jgi:hypothetical protein
MLLKETLAPKVDESKYTLRDSENNILVKINIDKFLSKLKKDSKNFYVDPFTEEKYHKNKIENAEKFIISNLLNQEPNDTKFKIYNPTEVKFTNKKLGILDGRHRLAALKKLGFVNTYIEVPKEQKYLFSAFA